MTGLETCLEDAFIEELVRRIWAEYREMPGLQLTSAQAGCLFGIDPPTSCVVFEVMCRRGMLQRRSDGRLVRI